MTTRKTALKIADHSAKQKSVERLSSRERLMRTIGPQVTYVTSPLAGEQILVKRPDVTALATNKDWPQPLTAAARTLIAEGDEKLKTPERIATYMELMYRTVLGLALVEPPELIEARALDDEEYEAARAEWEAARKPADKPKTQDELGAALARLGEVLDKTGGGAPVRKDTHRDAVLAGLDPDDLSPLFVAYGKDADEDQMVLLAPGDGRVPDNARGEFKFNNNDLYSIMGQLMTFQAGGLATFRG